jgi:starch-binding outer membrane protein, SusD/RagB family
MSNLSKYKYCTITVIVIFITLGCKKWIAVDSPNDKPDASVIYSSDALATAVLTGMYNQISAGSFATGSNGISVRAGLSADEFTGYSASGIEALSYYQNNILVSTNRFWSEIYKYIYTANSAIEGVTSSSQISMGVKNQLIGEAKFMRAFLHFYLFNLFGDIPLAVSTDFNSNSNGIRMPKADVYRQIIQDLKDAQELLIDSFPAIDLTSTTQERVRPNKGAATAMLARVYLYTEDFLNAELQSTNLIDKKSLYDTVSLNQAFLKNSKEAIWQLQPTAPNFNTQDGRTFVLTAAPSSSQPVAISPQLYAAFENGDKRKTAWVKTGAFNNTTYYSPYKYKVQTGGATLTEYLIVLRISEQYLIRAEAKAQLSKISESLKDLNIIRKKAGLNDTTVNNKQELLTLIEHERQVELFSEWGHRWLDLKRTNRVDAFMNNITPLKGGGAWQSYKQLYPIPQGDIDKSYSLSQNPEY